jgi:hypothetical protein
MTRLYFRCSNTKKVFVDQRGAVVDVLEPVPSCEPA